MWGWLCAQGPGLRAVGKQGLTRLEGRAPGAWRLAVNYSPATWSSMTLDKSVQPSGLLPSLTSKLGEFSEMVTCSLSYGPTVAEGGQMTSVLSSVLQNNHIPRGSRGYQMGLLG